MSTAQATLRSPKSLTRRKSASPAVTAERMQEMLREIAFVLHATRVVARRMSPARKKGC